MRSLHIVAGLPLGGGMSTSVPLLAIGQKELGHDVTVATLGSALGAEIQTARESGVEFLVFKRSRPLFLFFSWGMFVRLHQAVRRMDVVHVHSNWTFPVWWGCCLAWLYNKKLVMSPRGCLDPTRLVHSGWKKKMVGWIDRLCFRYAAVIHATSHAESNWVTQYLGERYKSKIRIVPNGLSVPDDECRGQQPPSFAGERVVLSLGRLHPLKGLDLLMEAWHILSVSKQTDGWRLVIAGPDEQGVKNKLIELREKFTLKNCEFCDGVYDGRKWDLLRNAELFVFPSRSENFGIVAGEALACGTPVVMTDVGPWKAEMEGYFGAGMPNVPIQFVETGVSGIAEGLSRVMALGDGVRAEMGRNGQSWVRSEFQWERVAIRMIEAYEN